MYFVQLRQHHCFKLIYALGALELEILPRWRTSTNGRAQRQIVFLLLTSTLPLHFTLLAIFSQLLISMFGMIKYMSCFLTQFSPTLTIVHYFYSVLLPTFSPELFPLHCCLIVVETHWDERCHHHIFTKSILTPVVCKCCLYQVHRTALLSFLFTHQFFSRNRNCAFLGFRQFQWYDFLNKRLGIETLNLTKTLISLYTCHFILSLYRLCQKASSYFILYFTLFPGKSELHRDPSFCIYSQILYIPQAKEGNGCLSHPCGLCIG